MPRQTRVVKTLPQILREEIGANGVLPFARFMNLALYCPELGYYEQHEDTVGQRGDFITSVSTGRLFGELLAFQFAGWLEQIRLRSPPVSKVKLVEAGAHNGRLAHDILSWLSSQRPELFSKIEYIILEPSARRQAWQQETLKQFAANVRWAADVRELSPFKDKPSVAGIIFSNELLDAFPIHRHGWDVRSKSWFEWGVAAKDDRFVWVKIPRPANELPRSIQDLPASLLNVLPDNFTVENSPAAEGWWRGAAEALSRGWLMAIDYGFGADEQISPARSNGTLRAYFRHSVSDDVLANPGGQDLTAHVNFPAIQRAGEAAGLRTESLQTQPQFLTGILQKAVRENAFGPWDASRTRQFQTLTHPEHLGRAFRVLIQSR